MEILTDVKKIINQALGRQNMFGFRTTSTNQLYLMFCCWGNAYYADNISRKTKYLWFTWLHSVSPFVLATIVLYLIYGRHTGDILLLIYNAFVCGLFSLCIIVKPILVMFRYKKDIEETIRMADTILTKNLQSMDGARMESNGKKSLKIVMIIYCFFLSVYTLIPIFDVIFFYENEKFKDYTYYTAPFSGLEHYGSVEFFIIYYALYVCVIPPFFLVFVSHQVFALIWVMICIMEAQRITDVLNSLTNTETTEADIEYYKSIESEFKKTLRRVIYDINDLTRLISSFRGFFEACASVTMPALLYIEIVHALVFVTPRYPMVVRLREITVFILTLWEIFIICWIGSKLEELASKLSFAVYSTPWYWLKSVRKDVYILLCQTQTPIEPVALNVYPLKLATFLRFCNVINSSVNVFRVYTAR